MDKRGINPVVEGPATGNETKVVDIHRDQEMGSDGINIDRIESVYK